MVHAPPVKIPRVARRPRAGGAARMGVVLALAGGGVFAALAHGRAAHGAKAAALPPLTMVAATSEPPPAADPPAAPAPPAAVAPQAVLAASPYRASSPMTSRPNGAAAERARRAAPALIVDVAQLRPGDGTGTAPVALGDGGGAATIPTATLGDPASPPTGAALSGAGVPDARDTTSDERFAARAGSRETEIARAYRLPNQDRLVPLGTVIGAVMETALNSDVPGFARAITTRDVLSFDGSRVVIPAGSHVIGEYKSGVAQGASRIFIVWTRLVRPDGVAIALASPATDDLGGGGLGGKVSRHFLERFGGAVLLSVLTGGLNAATQSLARGSTVVVSSSTEATSLAGEATRGTNIAPTITTRQGAAVRIFVARDLDFSGVGPAP